MNFIRWIYFLGFLLTGLFFFISLYFCSKKENLSKDDWSVLICYSLGFFTFGLLFLN